MKIEVEIAKEVRDHALASAINLRIMRPTGGHTAIGKTVIG
jgi:hypothetical protein